MIDPITAIAGATARSGAGAARRAGPTATGAGARAENQERAGPARAAETHETRTAVQGGAAGAVAELVEEYAAPGEVGQGLRGLR